MFPTAKKTHVQKKKHGEVTPGSPDSSVLPGCWYQLKQVHQMDQSEEKEHQKIQITQNSKKKLCFKKKQRASSEAFWHTSPQEENSPCQICKFAKLQVGFPPTDFQSVFAVTQRPFWALKNCTASHTSEDKTHPKTSHSCWYSIYQLSPQKKNSFRTKIWQLFHKPHQLDSSSILAASSSDNCEFFPNIFTNQSKHHGFKKIGETV